MSAEDTSGAAVTTTTATTTTVGETDDAQAIARPAHWVASLLWIILVLTCALVALGAAAALILDFLAGTKEANGAKETILLIFSTAFNGLIALFVTRPGTR